MKEERFGLWTVDDDGMQEAGGYWIHKSDLGMIRGNEGVSEWAMQVITKTWCDPETFIPALKRALERHDEMKYINWDATIRTLQRRAYWQMCQEEAERRLYGEGPYSHTMEEAADRFEKVRELATTLAEVGWYPPNAQRLKARASHAARALTQADEHQEQSGQ